ncbi:carbohydrate ABC transporter permease [Paenibacillus sp. D2_2]|uniref:carbohydrate ABC transporter permease n=1 Tax=Paenibacillus sp. D2_2 TaxID=3073092 RepID=UPI00281539E6|nr:carbohydrate ABC transporter permease [Paenibacillus sp. D2_2]WMT41781.1 carbohydrate ABC transporter permease [Paenibacillus sp. D2_2]
MFTALVSYPLSKKYLTFRGFYVRIGVVTMYFFGGIIPTYLLLNALGLIDTFMVYIIPSLYSFFNAILFINFFGSIPDALEESAKIDGANDWRIFRVIFLPLSAPILATVSLFYGVQQWNSWFDAAYYTNSEELATLQLVLYQIISQANGAAIAANYLGAGKQNINIIDSMKYATMVISIIPVAVAYPFLQKFFVQGMLVGSVKG